MRLDDLEWTRIRGSLTRIAVVLGLGLLLGAWGAPGTTEARHDAARFILEKLRTEHGEVWERLGKQFLWHYRFDYPACELTIERQSAYGDALTQVVPMAQIVPEVRADGALALYCAKTTTCVEQTLVSPTVPGHQQGVGEARLLVSEPDDVPKLASAFAELHRLCDDAYRGVSERH